jgi:hypothetical protein
MEDNNIIQKFKYKHQPFYEKYVQRASYSKLQILKD